MGRTFIASAAFAAWCGMAAAFRLHGDAATVQRHRGGFMAMVKGVHAR